MTTKNSRTHFLIIILLVCGIVAPLNAEESEDDKTLRVFIFAGQSNMVGSDSKVKDIDRFPPFVGLGDVQEDVKFSYSIGRENKMESKGWVTLQPVNNIVGPELSFARDVCQKIKAPIAIIKCAAGGTHLGGDWNPDDPSGFKMYPLALGLIQSSLAELDRQKIKYRIEGFMWHQGENDMFNKDYMPNYGKNLKNFVAKWRRDLETPELRFYIGELCTKTIWGMDLRPRMYAISRGQKGVTESDPLSQYVPTSHVGVEIDGGVGLHYHYGTLGQLQHGVNYATAYLRSIGKASVESRQLKDWPYKQGSSVKLFVLAGHRNMEGERAFIQELKTLPGRGALLHDNSRIAYKYSLGGGYKTSDSWEPLGPAGYYDFRPGTQFWADIAGQDLGQHRHCEVHTQRFADQRLDTAGECGGVAEHLSPVRRFYQGGHPGTQGPWPTGRTGWSFLSSGRKRHVDAIVPKKRAPMATVHDCPMPKRLAVT
ncbi:MAG TPA: hypothetical protein EYQ75_04070 [Planctomycetaceae bacterium]|nr:hypothetical protein [Planctomycetaceae bacterium]